MKILFIIRFCTTFSGQSAIDKTKEKTVVGEGEVVEAVLPYKSQWRESNGAADLAGKR